MKLSVNQITRQANDGIFTFDEPVDVSELISLNNDIRQIDPVHVYGNCVIQEEQYIFSFTIDGEMILPCARTLVDVPYPFSIRATEVFTLSSYMQKDDEDEIHIISGEILDLMPYIKENILLEVPYRVFSDDSDVQNNAVFKGEGWDFVSEENKQKTIDPRLKKLESLLNKDNKDK